MVEAILYVVVWSVYHGKTCVIEVLGAICVDLEELWLKINDFHKKVIDL